MDEDGSEVLFRDPALPWPGAFPYDVLARAGVGPGASAWQVQEALFDLMAGGSAGHDERAAWDELRHIERRLLVDFFMYRLPLPDEALFEPALWESPMPLELPDFSRLDLPVDYASALPGRVAVDPGPPLAPLMPPVMSEPPLDLGPLAPPGIFAWRE